MPFGGYCAGSRPQLAVGDRLESGLQPQRTAPSCRVGHQLADPFAESGSVGVALHRGSDDLRHSQSPLSFGCGHRFGRSGVAELRVIGHQLRESARQRLHLIFGRCGEVRRHKVLLDREEGWRIVELGRVIEGCLKAISRTWLLQAAARVDGQRDARDVPGFIGGQEKHRVTDVHRLHPTDRQHVHHFRDRLEVVGSRVLQVRPE